MKHFFFFLFIIAFSYNIKAQDIKAEIHDPPIPYEGTVDSWGTDYVVSNTEPLGRPSGIYRTSNNTIYVAIPDTSIIAGRSLVVLSSTNNGANWSTVNSVSPGGIVIPKCKMVGRPGSDSIYCVMLIGSTVYTWNVITNNFNQFTLYTTIRDFDAVITSTNSLYLVFDLNTNNEIRWNGSINGGVSWAGAIFLTSAGARPRMSMSLTGDTAVINYYGPVVGADTLTSAIRNVRYRESVAGTLAIVGSFTTPIAAGTTKDQFEAVRNGTNVWVFYTSGVTGSIDLNCILSGDGGTTYGAPFTIGSMPSRDEYWFDAKPYGSGVDLIFYSDSLQAGAPTNSSDRIMNCFALNSTPAVFSAPVQLSNFPPSWSARGYIPTLIEYHNAGSDAGAIWVGNDGANKRLFFDRYAAVTGISHNGNEIPERFSLEQNYPNPFNPSTTIKFALPNSAQVKLVVYDIIGHEVAVLVNDFKQSGSYEVDFNASSLASGVYFYKLESENFIDVKKMVLVK